MRQTVLTVSIGMILLGIASWGVAEDLGNLSANPFNYESSTNPFGKGSPFAPNGINNPYSPYGGNENEDRGKPIICESVSHL